MSNSTIHGFDIDELLAIHRATFGSVRMEGDDPDPGQGDQQHGDQTFTQADVDRIVADRLKREREAVKARYADYEDLKAKAGQTTTAAERIAALEKQIAESQHEALKRRVQAKHGISDEDADLFLTGIDEKALTAQAKRLAERASERKSNANHVPSEGNNPKPGTDPMREFARTVFGAAD